MNLFEHCVVKKVKDGWGVFTPTPNHDKDYVWFITKNNARDNKIAPFILVPTWVINKGGEIENNVLSISDAKKLAQEYDIFYSNAEW